MSNQENEIQRLEEAFPSVSGTAFAEARAKALASGLSVLQAEDSCLYEVFPDGRKILLKRLEPSTAVTPGKLIKIR